MSIYIAVVIIYYNYYRLYIIGTCDYRYALVLLSIQWCLQSTGV